MRTFGKQIGHRFVDFVHQVVDDEQNWLATVEMLQVRQAPSKFHDVRVLGKRFLILAVAVHDSGRWRFHHDGNVVDQLKHKLGLPASSRAGHQRRERMSKGECHVDEYDDDDEVRYTRRREHSAYRRTASKRCRRIRSVGRFPRSRRRS